MTERYEFVYWKEDGTAVIFDADLASERTALDIYQTIRNSPGVKEARVSLYNWLPSKTLAEWKKEECPPNPSRCIP